MIENMKEFLTAVRSARGWSIKEMAAQLGYSSATSLVRLEQDKANLESLLRFARLMRQSETVQMTAEEHQALDRLLERRQLTDDAYHATLLLHSLLRNELPPDQPMFVRDLSSGEVKGLHEHFIGKPLTRMLILNCLDMPFFSTLAAAVLHSGAEVRHCVTVSDNASSTVQRVLRILPMTYLNSYSAFTCHLPADQPAGLLRADILFCEYEADGAVHTDVLVANSTDRFDSSTLNMTLADIMSMIMPQPERFQPFGDNRLRQAADYGEYLQLCFDMERDREVMRIKPDFGLDQIPPEVVLNAAVDRMNQLPEAQQAMSGQLEDVFTLITERYQNYRTKHQPQYHVYKKQAMWHFVKTGQLSDHAWLLRPFTVQERLHILQSTLDTLRANPYMHITFLKNETDFRNEEIVYYDGTGVSIIKPETDYNLQGGHRESLVSQEKFMHVYRAFFLNSIIATHTLTEAQAIAELSTMALYLREQL